MKKLMMVATAATLVLGSSLMAQETLRILTWKGYAPQALVDKFEKQTGIKVELTFSNNEEMIAKLRATRGGGFDLAQPSQDRISSVQAKYKIYQPIDYSKIDTKEFVPSMLNAVKKNTKVKGKSYAVPFCYGTSGLIVNKKLAPDAKDYSDLLNPKYKGKISYRLKRPTLIGVAFAKGADPFAAYSDAKAYAKLMDKVGQDLIKAKPLVNNYWANGDALLSMLRSGEVTVAMGWDGGGWKLHKENPDIDFVAPKSGALGWIDTFAIPSKSRNVAAAYRWINFMLKPENAAYFTNNQGYGTASKGANKFLNAEKKDNFERTFTKADIDNIKWYPPVPARLEKIEGKILDIVKSAQ
ncbi:extracellular solute-binding protein [Sulfurospirillum sp. 1612]|uniref:extracellular solute-binding protein n=1 Tax=Sulfurospirillum sp. 1612 TaxID=3094835 RepID=UPI002F91F84C